jgi:hypothetical protein
MANGCFDIMHGGAQFVENYGQKLWVKNFGAQLHQ